MCVYMSCEVMPYWSRRDVGVMKRETGDEKRQQATRF